MNWRKWNNLIHRDLGYLCFGLTMIYAISGVAVNHIDIWNPTYKVAHLRSTLDPALTGGQFDLQFVERLLKSLDESGRYLNSFQPDPRILQIFVEGNTITVNLATGEILQEKVEARPLLRQVNFLHLNHPKKLWTWFADLYAVSLGLLALTGLFVLQGRKGITGRGAWLTTLGLLLPLFFLWLYH
jgi:uncharacterized protein